jgi:hypothetical protein
VHAPTRGLSSEANDAVQQGRSHTLPLHEAVERHHLARVASDAVRDQAHHPSVPVGEESGQLRWAELLTPNDLQIQAPFIAHELHNQPAIIGDDRPDYNGVRHGFREGR